MASKNSFVKLSAALLILSSLILISGETSHSQAMVVIQSTATLAATQDTSQTMDKLVDVGGFKLFIHCTGERTPVVVMDAGANNNSTSWEKVQPDVAQFIRVCAYDRADQGKSDPGPTPRTSLLFDEQLHTLLANSQISGPYVLVGHSFGGMNMRLFASLYPADVAGMVLVDAAHENSYLVYYPHTARGVDYKASAEEIR